MAGVLHIHKSNATSQGPIVWGRRGGHVNPNLLDRADMISFVLPNIL